MQPPRLICLAGLLALGASATACSDSPLEGARSPGVHFIAGAIGIDTITVELPTPLTVLVTDSAGRPAARAVVQFEGVAVTNSAFLPWEGQMEVRKTGQSFQAALEARTDESGRASVYVKLGLFAGTGKVVVRVPYFHYTDTARYTVNAGTAVRVDLAPTDSAAYVGQGYVLRANVVDRGGNPRTDAGPITVNVASGPATIDPSSRRITATAFGRVMVVAQAGQYSDTSWLSAVPRGQIAVQEVLYGPNYLLGLFLMQLDGSGKTPLAPGFNTLDDQLGVGWAPDGREAAVVIGDSVILITPGVGARTIAKVIAGGPRTARFSRDGAWIYYSRGSQGLYRIHRDGTGLQSVGTGKPLFGIDYSVTPSHDGRSIAYASSRTPCGVDDCIRVFDLASNTERVYNGVSVLLPQSSRAAWSPTEDLIAYSSSAGTGVIRSDGTGQRLLSPTIRGWIEWSPDGRWLLVGDNTGKAMWLIDTQSTLLLPLATFNKYNAHSWRP